MPFTIATWNINSVRLRLDLVLKLLKEQAIDVLCLQETKCPNDQFPLGEFRKLGFLHIAISGQKGYNGVAILSRHAFGEPNRLNFYGKEDARHIAVTLAPSPKTGAGLTIHNFYIPAGGDLADVAVNEKFAHKMGFLAELEVIANHGRPTRQREIVVGDLNVAPLEHDVWSHKQLLDVVSHTPMETEALERIRHTGGWQDAVRNLHPEPQKIYSWWSYRAADWSASDKGRRLDHIWLSDDIAPTLKSTCILREARGWEKPSDHVPVLATLEM